MIHKKVDNITTSCYRDEAQVMHDDKQENSESRPAARQVMERDPWVGEVSTEALKLQHLALRHFQAEVAVFRSTPEVSTATPPPPTSTCN